MELGLCHHSSCVCITTCFIFGITDTDAEFVKFWDACLMCTTIDSNYWLHIRTLGRVLKVPVLPRDSGRGSGPRASGLFVLSESESHSVVSDSLWPHGLYSPWNSPGQNSGVGSLSLLQGIFPTQGSNPGRLHCRWILYQLSHKETLSMWFSWWYYTW